ncbi:hypothetical protein GALL_472620 [mine drainage metagenome]|uniref:Uncharacterized protein n=1 Tax=mine drainage metagenome TaxID=410659 RepID=A0A1J5Q5C6_9ZZZZ
MPIPMQFNKMGKEIADIVQRVGALGVACNLDNLPGAQITVNVFGQLLAFFRQLPNLS